MARSLSNAKVFVSLVSDNLSIVLNRRGYAAASQGVAGTVGRGTGRIGKAGKEEVGRGGENSWVPDPVTGYYRPANRPDEIDVAELREIFLKQKIRPQ
uniref:Late embryogenesis abundant protein n=1 Tax=Sesuvium portulacastrum TaxID=221166 RepID=E3W6T3_SESPO|nr:late embryogenesis abundant protein [Sesuvium portulacastrum]